MERLPNDKMRGYLWRSTQILTGTELSEETGIDQSTISKYMREERNACLENQIKLLDAIKKLLSNRLFDLQGEDLNIAKELIESILEDEFHDLFDKQEMDDEAYYAIYEGYLYERNATQIDAHNRAEKVWEKLKDKSDIELLWLSKYYPQINRYFRTDLGYILNSDFPKEYEEVENHIMIPNSFTDSTELFKTLAATSLSMCSFEQFKIKNSGYRLDAEHKDILRKQFMGYFVRYEEDWSDGTLMDEFDSINLQLSDYLREDPFDNYPPADFISYVDLMMSITGEKWMRYGKYRFFVIREREKNIEIDLD